MRSYVCVHDTYAYLREAIRAGMEGRCPGVRVGARQVLQDGREVYTVEATDGDALACWIADLNAECRQECAHVIRSPEDAMACPPCRGPQEVRTWTRQGLLRFIQSPEPTPYQVRDLTTGKGVFVRCGMDALLYPLLTQRTVEVMARPPGVERPFRLVVGPSGIDEGPEEGTLAYLVLPLGDEDPDRTARERCPFIHIFPDRQRLDRWCSDLPPGLRERIRVLRLAEAFDWARERVERWPES